jgi:uncharacterized protein (TIGR02145 family)
MQKNLIFGFLIFLGLISCSKEKAEPAITAIDYDGNIYETVTIGRQIWLKQNLRVTHFRNGDPILRTSIEDLSQEVAPNYQWPNKVTNPDSVLYGRYYTWYAAADPREICPIGYHLPDSTEWRELINYLGGKTMAGGKLKESGTLHWKTPNFGANNYSGFSALPTGRIIMGYAMKSDISTAYWSSSTVPLFGGDRFAFSIDLQTSDAQTREMVFNKTIGMPVRCIKDQK